MITYSSAALSPFAPDSPKSMAYVWRILSNLPLKRRSLSLNRRINVATGVVISPSSSANGIVPAIEKGGNVEPTNVSSTRSLGVIASPMVAGVNAAWWIAPPQPRVADFANAMVAVPDANTKDVPVPPVGLGCASAMEDVVYAPNPSVKK